MHKFEAGKTGLGKMMAIIAFQFLVNLALWGFGAVGR